MFIRLWTLKEAYVKAKGSGISASPGLRSFGFELLLSNRTKRYEDQSSFRPSATQNSAESLHGSPESSESSVSTASSLQALTEMTQEAEHPKKRAEGSHNLGPFSAAGQPQAGGMASSSLLGPLPFNLGCETATNPMVSNEDDQQSAPNSYPWRELISAKPQSSGGSSQDASAGTFPWGTDHTTHETSSADREESTQASTPDEVQLPCFWSFRDRTPFRIAFKQSPQDTRGWAFWLMELQGGHTSALLAEIDSKFAGAESSKIEKQLKLRTFNTVPLQSEEVLYQSRYCRVIGFGITE